VNEFLSDDDHPVRDPEVSNDAEDQQRERLARVRLERDNALVERGSGLAPGRESDQNVIAADAGLCTGLRPLYEIRHRARTRMGRYREPVFF